MRYVTAALFVAAAVLDLAAQSLDSYPLAWAASATAATAIATCQA